MRLLLLKLKPRRSTSTISHTLTNTLFITRWDNRHQKPGTFQAPGTADPLHPTTLGRAGGKSATGWLFTNANNCQQPDKVQQTHLAAGRTDTQSIQVRAHEIERVAVTFSNSATSTISHTLTNTLFITRWDNRHQKPGTFQAPGTAVPLHQTRPAVPYTQPPTLPLAKLRLSQPELPRKAHSTLQGNLATIKSDTWVRLTCTPATA